MIKSLFFLKLETIIENEVSDVILNEIDIQFYYLFVILIMD